MRHEMKSMPKGGVYGKKEGAESVHEHDKTAKAGREEHRDMVSESETGGREYPDDHEESYGKEGLHGDLKHGVKFLEADQEGECGKEEGHMLAGKKHDLSIG